MCVGTGNGFQLTFLPLASTEEIQFAFKRPFISLMSRQVAINNRM